MNMRKKLKNSKKLRMSHRRKTYRGRNNIHKSSRNIKRRRNSNRKKRKNIKGGSLKNLGGKTQFKTVGTVRGPDGKIITTFPHKPTPTSSTPAPAPSPAPTPSPAPAPEYFKRTSGTQPKAENYPNVIKFVNEVAIHDDNLLNYEVLDGDIFSQKISNVVSIDTLDSSLSKLIQMGIQELRYIYNKSELEATIEEYVGEDKTYPSYSDLLRDNLSSARHHGLERAIKKLDKGGKFITRYFFNKIEDKIIETIMREYDKYSGSEVVEPEDVEEKIKEFQGVLFNDSLLNDRLIGEILLSIKNILEKGWILKDFNRGNVLFYLSTVNETLFSLLDKPPQELTSENYAAIETFMNENLKFMLIDWKYVSPPEVNRENNYQFWDREVNIANMLPMRSNIHINFGILFGSKKLKEFMSECDGIIESKRNE